MTYFEALLYGAVQGVTEYLPISSSAHLILLPKFLGENDPGLSFDVFLHLGTLLATVAYFWSDWRALVTSFASDLQLLRAEGIGGARTIAARSMQTVADGPGAQAAPQIHWAPIALATIPALFAGALLHKQAETVFRGNQVLMTTLVIGGLLLFLSDQFAPQKRSVGSVRLKDAFLIGLAQCLALVPGMSRSGSTITGGRLLQLDRSAAARFSFLISAPITAAALVFELRKWRELAHGSVGWDALLIAGVSSFVFGCIAIGGLMRMMRRFGYLSFAIYRVLLAFAIYRVLV